MKVFLIISSILITSCLNGQVIPICNHHSEIPMTSNKRIHFENNEEVESYIETLLKNIGIPMNFQIKECKSQRCRNNAFATMTNEGTRLIIYDDKWFEKLNSDKTQIESLTILAHELGHHLSAHTLFLKEEVYSESINYCSPRSSNFNPSKCNPELKQQYIEYLFKNRIQELEADRFAGYIMGRYSNNLDSVQQVYKKFTKEYNDTLSTHPTISKRLNAIKDGFNLAKKDLKNRRKLDIQKVKGSLIQLSTIDEGLIEQIKFTEKRLKLIEKLQITLSTSGSSVIKKKYDIPVYIESRGSIPDTIRKKVSDYLGITYPGKKLHYDKNVIFCFKNTVKIKFNKTIQYSFYPAFHIKEGRLLIIFFSEQGHKIVYNSIAKYEEISFKEIDTLLAEKGNFGFQIEIEKSLKD